DGYDDLLVGAPRYGTNSTGRAYLYYGGASPDTVPDLVLSGSTSLQQFGSVLAGVGDLDQDGFDDFAIGEPGANSGGVVDAGRVLIFRGGLSPSGTAALVVSGTEEDEALGATIDGGRDVNGDGYPDFAVASTSTLTGSPGRVRVFYGGASLDGDADLTLAAGDPGDRFGTGLSIGSDTDGDGRADVVVGAPEVELNGVDGGVFLYRAKGPSVVPSLYRLADVPGDQGGFLTLGWTRSDAETSGVTGYLIERSEPAGAGGYAWEPLATVPASGNPRYAYTAATTSDQTASNGGVMCFRVTASGASGEAWRSVVRCAASVDNLAPAAPGGLAASASGDGDVLLTVETLATPPADLAGYAVYRSADATCDATDTPLATVPDDGGATVAFEDDATAFGTDVWYCAAAADVHSNLSAFTPEASANPAVLAAVKVVLQGAYASGLPGGALMRTDIEDELPLVHPFGGAPWRYRGPEALDPTDVSPANGRPDVLDQNEVVDWVLVGVRSTATRADEGRAAALLLADGTLLDPATGEPYASVKPVATGAYHVVVYHRSHLAAM
ncbi:MAG: integrin alpha, partial [Bacteroidota bacterium]